MLLVVLVAVGAVLLATGSAREEEPPVAGAPSGATSGGHVHGLGLAPAGDGLLIATHNGLYRAAGDGSAPVQVSAERACSRPPRTGC
jgi:hypothetical protein